MFSISTNLLKSSVLVLASFSSLVTLAEPTIQPAPIEKIFTIRGFDDNDFVEVVAYGKLPSTCYKLADASASIDSEDKSVEVKVNALFYDWEECIQVQIPYFKVVELGVMQHGEYAVKTQAGRMPNTFLEIDTSSSRDRDEHLYAPVKTATIVRNPTSRFSSNPPITVSLKGTFPYMLKGCMVIKEIKDYYTPENVVVIMPIAEVKDESQCNDAKRDFNIQHPLHYDVHTPSLVHVRVMNGEALNQLIE